MSGDLPVTAQAPERADYQALADIIVTTEDRALVPNYVALINRRRGPANGTPSKGAATVYQHLPDVFLATMTGLDEFARLNIATQLAAGLLARIYPDANSHAIRHSIYSPVSTAMRHQYTRPLAIIEKIALELAQAGREKPTL